MSILSNSKSDVSITKQLNPALILNVLEISFPCTINQNYQFQYPKITYLGKTFHKLDVAKLKRNNFKIVENVLTKLFILDFKQELSFFLGKTKQFMGFKTQIRELSRADFEFQFTMPVPTILKTKVECDNETCKYCTDL